MENVTSEFDRPAKSAPTLIYLVTEDWYFLSHRIPMAKAALAAGYQVHVATHVGEGGARIEALGFHLHPLAWRRGSINPLDLIGIVRQVRALYRRLSPDIVHHVAVAAVGRRLGRGVGNALRPTQRLCRSGLNLHLAIGQGAHRPPGVQDAAAVDIESPGFGGWCKTTTTAPPSPPSVLTSDRVFLIPGSGVDVDALPPLPEPAGMVTVAFVGRLLEDKGLRTLIAAHDLLTQRGTPVRLMIAGQGDPANPASIPDAEIESWKPKPNIELLGHVIDIGKVWADAHIAVLPSRREGLPKSLLEAASSGRPIVATDVPGCREIARAGVNALLVPPDDPAALAHAIEQLARDPALRRRFGEAGRRLVVEEFSSDRIGQQAVALYDRLLGR